MLKRFYGAAGDQVVIEEFVLGPDKAPYDGWCREVVLSTAATLKGVINFMSGKC